MTDQDVVRPLFFYVVPPSRVKPGDMLYEINDRPLRGGPMPIKQARRSSARSGGSAGWELVPQTSRVSRFVDAGAQLRVGGATPIPQPSPIVAAAAASIRKPKRRNIAQPLRDQLALFEIPGVTK